MNETTKSEKLHIAKQPLFVQYYTGQKQKACEPFWNPPNGTVLGSSRLSMHIREAWKAVCSVKCTNHGIHKNLFYPAFFNFHNLVHKDVTV
jgi:hypothetical protein